MVIEETESNSEESIMAFRISEMNTEKPKTTWVPIDNTDTIYVGQIVVWQSAATTFTEGILPLGAAAGAADTTGKNIPYGVVVGTNRRDPLYNSTWKANSIVDVVSAADQKAIEKVGGHGSNMPVGDQRCMVEVAIITPSTVLEGPIYNGAYGTAPTEVTVSGASADGGVTAATVGTLDYTPVTAMCTAYGRSGGNAGAYRVTTGTTTTEIQVVHQFPNATIAIGDTFVGVPMKKGLSFMQLDAEAMYIDASASPATNYFVVNCLDLKLGESGKETAVFMFGGDHFCLYRA